MYAIRPSAAWIWILCHGYARMCELFPEVPGVFDDTVREEGNACHWAAHEIGKGNNVTEGTLAPNGVEIDSAMLEAVAEYLGELRSWGVPIYQEVTLPAAHIHPQCGGTPDAFGFDLSKGKIYVGDLKYGYRFVDVFENLQLAIYAIAVLEWLAAHGLIVLNGHTEQWLEIEFVIVQPRSFGGETTRRWVVKAAQLRGLWNQLRDAAHSVAGPDPKLVAGDHCLDCQARLGCPAFQRLNMQSLNVTSAGVPHELTLPQQGNLLRMLKFYQGALNSMVEGLEQQLEFNIGKGYTDPYWVVGHGRSSERWIDSEAEAQALALARVLKTPIDKPARAITPKQAKALLPAEVVERFSVKTQGRRKLVPFNDKSLRKLGIE